MQQNFLYYLAAINLLAFGIWGIDKALARLVTVTGRRRDQGSHSPIYRIPEKWLLALALAGGCWGCWAGVFLFRHKLRKPTVLWPLFAFSLLHLVILSVLLTTRVLS